MFEGRRDLYTCDIGHLRVTQVLAFVTGDNFVVASLDFLQFLFRGRLSVENGTQHANSTRSDGWQDLVNFPPRPPPNCVSICRGIRGEN